MMKQRLSIFLGIVLVIALLCRWVISTITLPSFTEIKQQSAASYIQILARDGTPLERIRANFDQRRLEWTALEQFSSAIQEMVLRSEDKRFYQHSGVDWLALGNALVGQVQGEATRGASTISMQLVGMLVPELQRQQGSRRYAQKIQQMFYAMALEGQWSKQQILEAYLNLVPLRGELVGIPAGAQGFFQKYPEALNMRESALLAAMLRAPNADVDKLVQRSCALIKPDSCEYLDRFVSNAVKQRHSQWVDSPTDAPHLARRLISQYRTQYLHIPENLPSTIEAPLQRFVQERMHSRLVELFAERVSDAAVVVLDNNSGEVLAYVGSSGQLSTAIDVDHANALRQAGSTLKPFVYAYALDKKRLTAASLLNDDVLSLPVDTGLYIPQNYDRGFKGWVSVRTALASSLNIPAVQALTMLNIEAMRDVLVSLGLPLNETGEFYGYSLALGSADVTLLSLTNAYRALANGGQYRPVSWLLIQNTDLSVDNQSSASAVKQVLSPESSWIIGDILSDRQARALTFGLDSALSTPFWTAVKTGTSKDMRDNWTVGWSSHYTVGVWVGNSAGESMRHISGVSGAAPIWHDIMQYLHRELPSMQKDKPNEVLAQRIDYEPKVEPSRTEYFLDKTAMKTIRLVGSDVVDSASFISEPTQGTIIALDPDIPKERQLVKFEAKQLNHQVANDVYWVLNGETLGGQNPLFWPVRVGRYTLSLYHKNGRKLDEIRFQVRGIR
ncbi:penicillin-binding protein 1C [Pelistega suis]|uniref:penicillin-binding protein 1C n=1 Tax=Pelistega suis TaxID=1631957 RepID=UPI00211CABB6|nr:penicillin-binding protein 1C [Pelistega suis]MCQ9328191.1 penicillin-binding protein 1C [Pelistega suis]